jgi:ribosomal protein S18 acetylase RimI-like enzyme
MQIRTPSKKDVKTLLDFESKIDKDLAADRMSIEALIQMFPEGFFIAEGDEHVKGVESEQTIIGFVSAVLWDNSFIPDFGKLHGTYSHTHTSSGKTMFIHTLLVSPENRRKGIGTALVGEELNLAALLQLDRVCLISPKKGVKMFERLGFSIIQHLPEFLPYHQDRFVQPMLMECLMK